MAFLSLSWILDGVIIILCAFFAAYLYMTRNFGHWIKKGVIGPKPVPFFGNLFSVSSFQKSGNDLMESLYSKYKDQSQVGFYAYDRPSLLVRDVNLVNRILVKDFDLFPNRYAASGDHDPLGSANLFMIKNPHWKILRSKLSPTMSSGKLKKMFQLMVSVGKDLETHLESLKLDDKGQVVEMREIWAKFTTDIIATCAYGLQANCLNNPDAEFRKYGKKIFDFDLRRAFELGAVFFIPGIVKPLGLMVFEKSTSAFLRKALWDTLIQRMENGICRDDLIDTLIELKKAQAQVDVDDPDAFKFDGDNLIAQGAVYFTGGFETTSSTLAFALYELALQPEIQLRLREEITSALDENDGEVQYEWVTQLPYLDMVVSETLRKYPVLGYLERVAIRDYKVPDSDLVIEEGTPVYISVSGFHHDPKHFPNPEQYNPDRFSTENKQKRSSHVYMPFGDGPRNCIGRRFGLLSVKIGLIKTIPYYKFTPCNDTQIPVRMNPRALFVSMRDGLFLDVQRVAKVSR